MLRPLSIILSNIGSSSPCARSLSAPICCLSSPACVRSVSTTHRQGRAQKIWDAGAVAIKTGRHTHRRIHMYVYLCVCICMDIFLPVSLFAPISMCISGVQPLAVSVFFLLDRWGEKKNPIRKQEFTEIEMSAERALFEQLLPAGKSKCSVFCWTKRHFQPSHWLWRHAE